MKRRHVFLLLLLASINMFAQSGKCGNNLKWSFDQYSGTLTITGTGKMTDFSSSTIDAPWKRYTKRIWNVSLPDGLTSIGSNAFVGCPFSYIKIPTSVRQIGALAFSYCSNLSSIVIPQNVNYIGKYAFMGCSNLSSIDSPQYVNYIGQSAFSGCSKLSSATIPKSLNVGYSQNSTSYGTTSSVKNDISKRTTQESQPVIPPLLVMEEGSFLFSEPSGNNIINANESCSIQFRVKNSGKGPAIRCEARVKLAGAKEGITVKTVTLPKIEPGKSCDVSIPITSNINTTDGNVTMSVEVYEPNGWGVAPFDLTVATKAFEPPFLQVVDYNITSSSGLIRKMEPFTLTFNLQNTKYGDAEEVSVKLELPANIYVMDGPSEVTFPQVKSGEAKPIALTLAANNKYSTTEIPINIDIKEKYGKFSESKQINLVLNAVASSNVTISAKDEPQLEHKEIKLALLSADVDRDIPIVKAGNTNTYVLIIANETYRNVAPVQFAIHDGEVFRQYCEQTLGVTEKNRIKTYMNATLSDMLLGVEWLKTALSIVPDARAIVYYTGHGIPDETSKSAYLLPTDGNSSNLRTAYAVDELYKELGMTDHPVTVFLDACFSGAKRDGSMLASAKGVAIKAKAGSPQGKTVVFSAATGDETAGFYQQQQHGMFTYWLLKILQQTKGDVTYEQLNNYLLQHVRQSSFDENGKVQTPTVMSGSSASDWKQWTLKR